MLDFRQPGAEHVADLAGVFQQPLPLDHLDGGDAGAGGDRVAAKRRGVHSGAEAGRDLGGGQHGRAGQAAADGLRQGHDVGGDAEVLVGEPVAGPPETGLHLVENQQQVVLIGQPAEPLEEAFRRNPDASFALDRLDHDRGGLIVDERLDGGQVSMRSVDEAGHQRPEAFVILRLRRGCRRAERPPVKSALECDNLVTVLGRVQADQLDGRFIGLGAGVAEEGLPAETPLAQGLGPAALEFGIPGIGDVDQPGDLILDGSDDRGGAVPQQAAAPTGKQVEIAVALGIPNVRPLAADERDREPIVVGDHVLFEQPDNSLGIQRGVFGHDIHLLPAD